MPLRRTCSFHLYGWACEHPDVAAEAAEIRAGKVPAGYPESWPAPGRKVLPLKTTPYSERVIAAIAKRKQELRQLLEDTALANYPRDEVLDVLKRWAVEL
jgi:hypothetical protein